MVHTKLVQSIQEQSTEAGQRDGLKLVSKGLAVKGEFPSRRPALEALPELASISARRCSSFFAEAAVLVLVFGILDFLMQHGHIEGGWVLGAFSISVTLLAASVATEFSARRWLGAQP